MNINMLNILKQIAAQYGEEVLENPRRLKAFFSDLAKDEPKPLRLAFGKCVEHGYYRILKDTKNPEERREVIESLARRLRDEEGLDSALCAEALELLAAAIFGEGQIAPEPESALAAAVTLPAASPPPVMREAPAEPPPAQPAPVCAGCRAELKAQWKFCPYCGTPVQGAAPELISPPALSAAVSSSGGAGYGIGLIDPPPAKPRRKRAPARRTPRPSRSPRRLRSRRPKKRQDARFSSVF
jgi:hypothetical protein